MKGLPVCCSTCTPERCYSCPPLQGLDDANTATAAENLATALGRKGNFEEARRLMQASQGCCDMRQWVVPVVSQGEPLQHLPSTHNNSFPRNAPRMVSLPRVGF